MTTQRWKTSNTVVFNISYHLIWCPKYRRKVLNDNIASRLKELLIKKSQQINVHIEKIAIMPDHVHLFVKSTSINAPHYIVQQLKGYSSRILRQEFKSLKTRLPSLWTRSYYVETIGHISEKTVKKYIEDQKNIKMILTYKIKHNENFDAELNKAKQVAIFGIKHGALSSKSVKQFGLKSMISNQILRKYVKNKKIKQVHKVNLIIPNQGIKVNKKEKTVSIPCLKFSFDYQYLNNFEKINQIEINNQFVFVSVSVNEKEQIDQKNAIGVDLNTTGHTAVIANPQTGKVVKLGKKANHIHTKYKNIRKRLAKES